MRSRFTVSAALALGAVTILTIAACGSAVQGSAQANSAAAETMTSSSSSRTSVTTRTARTTSSTGLSDLSSALSELSALGTAIPSDLSIPSDFPSDLNGLSNIPGYNSACISVSLAYLSVTLAPLATLAGGSGQYDASDLKKAFDQLRAQTTIPPEIAPDIQALEDIANQAGSGSLSDAAALFQSDTFVTASDHISAWLDANCGGS